MHIPTTSATAGATHSLLSWIIFIIHVQLSKDMRVSTSRGLFTRPLRITTVEIEPYVMPIYIYGANGSASVLYQGFIVDLIHEISLILRFQYEILPNKDGKFGHRQSDGTWDGMIGDLKNKKADLAASPMFITEHREKVVDFSVPFLNVQATLLLRKPPDGAESPIKSVGDLINQSEIKYGTLNTGLITWSFRNTNHSVDRILWRNMMRFESSALTDSNEVGIRRVRQEKYGFIIPSTIGEYIAHQFPCDLITVDRFLMDRGYGLAVVKESELLSEINRAIKQLKEEGFIQKLYHRWWIERSECAVKSSKMYDVSKARRTAYTLIPLMASLLLAHT